MKKIDNFLIEDIKYTLKSFIPDIIQFLDLPYGEQWNREDTEEDSILQAAHAVLINAKIGYGQCFSIKHFIEDVETGGLIDYDGCGYWVNVEGNELGPISCNVEWLRNNKPKDAKFIMWYNK